MIRITRLTDYGIVLLANFAQATPGATRCTFESSTTTVPLTMT